MMRSTRRERSPAARAKKHARCPFNLEIEKCTRKHGELPNTKGSTAKEVVELLFQPSPFNPTGKFPSHATMDIYYHIEPPKDWASMQRYHTFTWNSDLYQLNQFVYVANDETEEQGEEEIDLVEQTASSHLWVAQILEIRAQDVQHVYARVCWMYSPNELEDGRQIYHGKNELLASNHLDIINVSSIVAPAEVSHWNEADDGEIQHALYWRQAFDYRTKRLSAISRICACSTPANPDNTLVGCTNSNCGHWLHIECLREDVLLRAHESLGKTNMATGKTDLCIGREPRVASKQGRSGTAVIERRRRKQNSRKKKSGLRKPDVRPWDGILQATLRMDHGPLVWEIKDLLRARIWLEKVVCLKCNAEII